MAVSATESFASLGIERLHAEEVRHRRFYGFGHELHPLWLILTQLLEPFLRGRKLWQVGIRHFVFAGAGTFAVTRGATEFLEVLRIEVLKKRLHFREHDLLHVFFSFRLRHRFPIDIRVGMHDMP